MTLKKGSGSPNQGFSRTSYPLKNSPLFRLESRKALRKLLQLSESDFQRVTGTRDNYVSFPIVDKKGKSRIAEVPKTVLRRVHKRILTLLQRIQAPDYLASGIKGRSYIWNAKNHCGERESFSVDIRKFFPSTSWDRIHDVFRITFNCSPDVSWLLTNLVAHGGHLPTGGPLSTLLSFYSHRDLFEDIHAEATAIGCKLTVYVDDIVISGESVPGRLQFAIKKAIHNRGLKYHKTRFAGRKQAKLITGVVVNGGEVRLPNSRHQKLDKLRRDLKPKERSEAQKDLLDQLQGRLADAAQLSARWKSIQKAYKGRLEELAIPPPSPPRVDH